MACDNINKDCPCTYPCSHHGKCCECIAYHRPNEVPACYFSKQAEKTYDRSINGLIKDKRG